MLDLSLTPEDLELWNRHRYLRIANPFSKQQLEALKNWTQELSEWPESPGKWLKYFEAGARRQLCRVENFLPYHSGFRSLIESPVIFRALKLLMGSEAVLFKEKINFKLPGGEGFEAHQDAPAFVSFGQKFHITLMVAIDPATRENGGMEFSSPIPIYHTLPQAPGGTIDGAVEKKLPWFPLDLDSGDLLFFDSYLPHRSSANQSQHSRRAAYITYNRESEGSYREEYFSDKRSKFPPDCERVPGQDYSGEASIYNLGNPIG